MSKYVLIAAILLGLTDVAAAVDITECGQEIEKGETGVLQNDLVCTSGYAILMEDRATLDFNGKTLTLQDGGGYVYCYGRRCTITSTAPTYGRIICDGCHGEAIVITRRRALIERLEVSGTKGAAIYATEKAGRLVARNLDLHHNGEGIFAFRLDLSDSTVSQNSSHGASGYRKLRAKNVAATGNSYGLRGRRMRVESSAVTGNGTDIFSRRRPRLLATTCGTSQRASKVLAPLGITWGVCAND